MTDADGFPLFPADKDVRHVLWKPVFTGSPKKGVAMNTAKIGESVNPALVVNDTTQAAKNEAPQEAETTETVEDAAAIYTKSKETDLTAQSRTVGIADPEKVFKMKAEAEEKTKALQTLVEKMFKKQGTTSMQAKGLAEFYKNLKVDKETQLQAQKDIADDGYWGVEQTSDRLVDFAKALAGDDAELAAKMKDAIKQGFEEAQADWGEDLPDISKKTLDAAMSKMDEYIEGLKEKLVNKEEE